jgi:hypothetical protein
VIFGGHPLALVVPIHVCLVTLTSLAMTWLAQASGYSPTVAAVFHGSLNWAQQRVMGLLVLS